MVTERNDWTSMDHRDDDDAAQDFISEEQYERAKAAGEERVLWALEELEDGWSHFPDIGDLPVDDHSERSYAAFRGDDFDYETA